MRREGNTLSSVIRQVWDGENLRSMTKNSPGRATGAHISISGHITAHELRKRLDDVDAVNGFMNRFLIIAVERSQFLPNGGRLDLVKQIPIQERLRAAVAFAREGEGVELHRDEMADQLWGRIYNKLSTGGPGLLGAVTGRAEPQVMRLACLHAVADQSSAIGIEHLRAALEVWRYAYESAAYVFGDALGDRIADRIWNVLKDAGEDGLPRTQINHLFAGNDTASDIKDALNLLGDDLGLARMESLPSGGRPVERWFVAKSLWDEINEISQELMGSRGDISFISSSRDSAVADLGSQHETAATGTDGADDDEVVL